MADKTGVLLIQLGTPDSPSVPDVRKYLSEFLNDARVIDIPFLLRKMLVNLIIVPFRAPKSAKIYQLLWTKEGSPLLVYSESLKEKVQKEIGDEYDIWLAMRYQNPSMETILEQMRRKNYSRIILFPLFPQYASATTGSAAEKAMKIISKWWVIPDIKIIGQFYDHPGYIKAFIDQGRKYVIDSYDHVVFSYHGLPVRQVDKVHIDTTCCPDTKCETELNEGNKFCYKAVCYATTRLLVSALGLPPEKYTVSFQSRLDKNWLEPFTDKVIMNLAKKGAKKVLVFSPAFVADCLETVIEIGDEYKKLFKENGGEELDLVESLNDHPLWVNTVKEIILQS